MAVTHTSLINPFGKAELYTNSDVDENIASNIVGTPLWLKSIHVVNAAALTYLKFVNALTAIPGTTDPNFVLMALSGLDQPKWFAFEDDNKIEYPGFPMHVGMSIWAVTTPGTPGVVAPAAALAVRILYQRMTVAQIADLTTKGII